MKIREETPEDLVGIRLVHTASFPTPAEGRLVDALRSARNLSISLVASESSQVVGHVACSPVTTRAASNGLGLAPVAVSPGYRRRGIADQLIRAALELALEQGHPFMVVLGDPAFYSRFGFQPASTWNLSDEYGGEEAFQAIELVPGSIAPTGGLVRYSSEFEAL